MFLEKMSLKCFARDVIFFSDSLNKFNANMI